jgi:hypothetical protein
VVSDKDDPMAFSLHRILGSPKECLDMQVLLDPFEE